MVSDYQMLRKGIASVGDYQQLQKEFELKKQLSQAEVKKANQLDVDKLGEVAFMKSAMGQELTPQELAAAQYVDAKSGGVSFNPVTGEMIQRPRISDKIGLPGIKTQQGSDQFDMSQFPQIQESDLTTPGLYGNGGKATPPALPSGGNQYDSLYEESLKNAAGNPKLQQTIKSDYLKNKMSFSEGQSNAATYADRMRAAEAILTNPDVSNASKDVKQVAKRSIPLIGNFLVTDKFQQAEQAQRDFINAVLRRESGAVISPSEFENGKRQYFPQPGDSPAVLEQKRKNREAAINGISRSAGPAYTPTEIADPYAENSGAGQGVVRWEDLP